jgi:glucosyl-3-phosphoglycerate synthase
MTFNHYPEPNPALESCVVIPARNEADSVEACLRSLEAQMGVSQSAFEIIMALECTDDTEARVEAFVRANPELSVIRLKLEPDSGVGAARKRAMDLACDRLFEVGRPQGLIASTDADAQVAPDWLRTQLEAVAFGARAIGGFVEIIQEDRHLIAPDVVKWRRRQGRLRHRRLISLGAPGTLEHPRFSGASLAVTAEVYREVDGIEPKAVLEDEAFESKLMISGIPIERLKSVRVWTSARLGGRAFRGLSRDLALESWIKRRSYKSSDYSIDRLLDLKDRTVSIILPTRNVGATIGPLIEALTPLENKGLFDEMLVVDANSQDGTVEEAQARKVPVYQESRLMSPFGPAKGKGDAMWRGLSATSGQIVVFLDTDTENFSETFLVGLLGPLFEDRSIELIKGTFQRPFKSGESIDPFGGGRVTELMARPLLNLYAPELAGFVQPLAGEIAGSRALFESISWPVGYGIEIAMMIDSLRLAGLDALAQVDLGLRQNRHQPLRDLSVMAYSVLVAASRRVHGPDVIGAYGPGPMMLPTLGTDFEVRRAPVEERPPLADLFEEPYEQAQTTV